MYDGKIVNDMNRIIIITCLLCVNFFVNGQQMSTYLFEKLSKEHKPNNRLQVTLPELSNVMANAKWHLMNDAKAITELDTLCIRYAPAYPTIINKKDRLKFLYYLSDYWVGRVDSYPDSMLKYTSLVEAEMGDGIGFEKIVATTMYQKANAYLELPKKDYKNACFYSKKAVSILAAIHDSSAMTVNFLQLSRIYTQLSLYKIAENYFDSATQVGGQHQYWKYLRTMFRQKGDLLTRQFAENYDQKFADSLIALIKKYNDTSVYNMSTQTDFKSDLYFFKTQLHYYQKNYRQSLADIDSFFIVIGTMAMLPEITAAFNTFRGLNLIQLGNKKDGIAILAKQKPNLEEHYTGIMLQQLYNYEKEQGNTSKALEYHEQLMAFNANKQMLKHQGEVLEIEQQYNVAARDLQITNLKAQQAQYRSTGIIVAIVSFFIASLFFIRYRNNRKQTERLLNQVNELTEQQIFKVEEATKNAEAKERHRIGQELHDDLAGSMAGVIHFLRTKMAHENSATERLKFEQALNMLENSYQKTRSKSHDIYYRETPDLFIPTLTDNIKFFFVDSGIKVNTEIDNIGMDELTVHAKTTILYTIKEAVVNILKYAKSSTVDISLYNSNHNIYIEIKDDGIGLSNKKINKSSLGLVSIKERVTKAGGVFEFSNAPEGGTILRTYFPII